MRQILQLRGDHYILVNRNDPIPASWNLEISTNSQIGTLSAGQGLVSSTYRGCVRNHVLVAVPDRSDLIGRSFYLQVAFSDGESTSPVRVTIEP